MKRQTLYRWKIQYHNTDMLQKYGLYDVYSDLRCYQKDFEFTESLVSSIFKPHQKNALLKDDKIKIDKIKPEHFYTLLWLVVYFREVRFKEYPYKKMLESEKRKDQEEKVKIQKLKKEIIALSKDDRSKLNEIRFTIKGQPFKTDAGLILDQFYDTIIKGIILNFEDIKVTRKTNTKKEHTEVIELLRPFALLLWKEKILPNKNQVYKVIKELLSFYGFKVDRFIDQDFIDQIKNTLKLK